MSKELNVIFATNLDNFMRIKGVDRTQLCAELGFKYSTVSEWLSAKKYPRMDKIEMLADYFGVKKSDLIEPSFPYVMLDDFIIESEPRVISLKREKKQREDDSFMCASSAPPRRRKKVEQDEEFSIPPDDFLMYQADESIKKYEKLFKNYKELFVCFDKLNDIGKTKALERIEELTMIPDYKK